MKKKALLILASVIMLALCCNCSNIKHRIKMETGDVFTVDCDTWGESYIIENYQHNFWRAIKYYDSKEDLSLICDTSIFRCYKFANRKECFYICGLKPDGNFFPIDPNDKTSPSYFKEEYSDGFLNVFLADKYIMQVTMNYMDGVYHEEIMEMAQKLTSGNYEGLDKYGLTEEMINDKESLDEKISIMEEYLKANKEQTNTSPSVQ